MATEAGDMKLLGNFRKLIDLLTAEPLRPIESETYCRGDDSVILTVVASFEHPEEGHG